MFQPVVRTIFFLILILSVSLIGCQKKTETNSTGSASDQTPNGSSQGSKTPDAKYDDVDPQTVAAYEKLGCRYGRNSFNGFRFSLLVGPTAKGLPTFHNVKIVDGKPPKLPPVHVPFGLLILDRGFSDAGFRELKHLQNLTLIVLDYANVTDEGLKELSELKNLATLRINNTKVTDAGLKEFKGLPNLTWLDLHGTKVTDVGIQELKNVPSLASLTPSCIKDIKFTE